MKTESAKTAKMIREALKDLFPAVKFSVRSSNFSMGNSVDVSWTDGPTSEMVNSAINRFQSGDFDGMTDCYSYRKDRPDHPTSKYVHASRNISKEMAEYTLNYLKNVMRLDDFPESTLAITERYSTYYKMNVWEWEAGTDMPCGNGNGYHSHTVHRYANHIAINGKGEYIHDPNFFYWEKEVKS
jgi:hypothetical protein